MGRELLRSRSTRDTTCCAFCLLRAVHNASAPTVCCRQVPYSTTPSSPLLPLLSLLPLLPLLQLCRSHMRHSRLRSHQYCSSKATLRGQRLSVFAFRIACSLLLAGARSLFRLSSLYPLLQKDPRAKWNTCLLACSTGSDWTRSRTKHSPRSKERGFSQSLQPWTRIVSWSRSPTARLPLVPRTRLLRLAWSGAKLHLLVSADSFLAELVAPAHVTKLAARTRKLLTELKIGRPLYDTTKFAGEDWFEDLTSTFHLSVALAYFCEATLGTALSPFYLGHSSRAELGDSRDLRTQPRARVRTARSSTQLPTSFCCLATSLLKLLILRSFVLRAGNLHFPPSFRPASLSPPCLSRDRRRTTASSAALPPLQLLP